MVARLFRSDAMAERLGEISDFVFDDGSDSYQLTWCHLRDMDGEILAAFDPIEGWRCTENNAVYSDIVIYSEDVGEGE